MPPQAPTIYDKWQAGDRDSPTLSLLELPSETDKLFTFLRMEGRNGYDETEVEEVTGQAISRPRRWHLILERAGFLYSLNGITYLSELGKAVVAAIQPQKEQRRRVARVAVRILRKYQLNNPADRGTGQYPNGCDIHPYWALLRGADKLEGKLHWDEMNREFMRVFHDDEVDDVIEKIRNARQQPDYDPRRGGSQAVPLGERCHVGDDDNVRDHIGTPWFRRASAAGLLLESPGPGGDGYWRIPDDLRDIVHEGTAGSPPEFKAFATEEEWFRYYGSLGDERIPKIDLRLTPEMRRMPRTIPFDTLKAAIAALHGHYTDGILRQFHAGLNYLEDKHFVILAGVSGTGKTSLVKRYAYAVHGVDSLESDDPLFFNCAVRPDWTDPSGLTGHFDVFKDQYSVPPFLKAVLTANDYPDSPVFICLDEMNIARVEYYFSDALSAMETGDRLAIHPNAAPAHTSLGFSIEGRIPWPQNLFIVGTINIDETTHPLSHKVLDRAVLIDMSDVELGTLFDTLAQDGTLTWSVSRCREILSSAQAILSEHGVPFGYRLAAEFIRYHAFWASGQDVPRSNAAIDDQFVQKVLAKLRGSHEQAELLKQLAAALQTFSGDNAILPKAKTLIRDLQRQLADYGSFQANR